MKLVRLWFLPQFAIAFVCVFVLTIGINSTHLNIKTKASQHVIRIFYTPVTILDKKKPCSWLRQLKKQFKLCENDPGLSEVLLSARHLAISSCEEQFRYSRWNCSRTKKTFRNVYRETALLYAFASSALTYSIARACTDGKLINCNCAKEDNYKNNVVTWKWGLCSDNVKYAKKFTRNFLQLRNSHNDIFRHNSQLGINIVVRHVRKKCRCPGYSGSCSIKICWKQIESFEKIAIVLKEKYQYALITKLNNEANRNSVGKATDLLYLLKSPTFCKSTTERRCLSKENCATLCCGRGFNIRKIQKTELCNCRCKENSCFELQCDNCVSNEDEFFCK